MNRRTFLTISTLPIFAPAISLTQIPNNEKSVIWIWLGGGPTHIETFNPLPDGPDTHRSTVGHIQTNVSGIEIGAKFEKLATISDKLTYVRSFGHTSSDHDRATHLMHTGRQFVGIGNEQNWPSIGSIVSENFGGASDVGLPLYIRSSYANYQMAGFLGSAYNPFDMRGDLNKNKLSDKQLRDLELRLQALQQIDNFHKDNHEVKNLSKIKQQAYDLVFGQGKKAFDIKGESQHIKDKYGQFGEPFLVARRLIQHGCRFISINTGGWDNHQNIAQAMNDRCPPLDQAIFALLTDLDNLSLLKNTLVIITGEFGRTSINKNAGRDHFGRVSTLAFAGGSYNHGRTIGKTNNKADEIIDSPFSPMDLVATIFDHCGIPQNTRKTDKNGRPIRLQDGGKKIL